MERVRGTLTSWDDDRGFGFIRPAGGGRDLFLHISELGHGSARPEIGDELTYVSGTSPEGKLRAESAALTRSRPLARSSRRPSAAVAYAAILSFLVLYWYVDMRWSIAIWVPIVYVVTSLISFSQYRRDKLAAVRGHWRTTENTLLLLGLLGGWPGAIFAQHSFQHKTTKRAFQSVFWASVALNVIAFTLVTSPLVQWLSRLDLSALAQSGS